MSHQWFKRDFMKLWEYFCVENKNNLFNNSSSPSHHLTAIMESTMMQTWAFLCSYTRCSASVSSSTCMRRHSFITTDVPDYFVDVIGTFLSHGHGSSVAVYGGSKISRISFKKIIIWVPKMKVLRVRNNMRVINDRIFFFGYHLILKLSL